jgi:hypothetical protein
MTDDIVRWLEVRGLGHLAKAFTEAGIGLDVLPRPQRLSVPKSYGSESRRPNFAWPAEMTTGTASTRCR